MSSNITQFKKLTKSSLLTATLLVEKMLAGECSIEDFVSKYDNFYYYEALDGHEANAEQLQVLEVFRDAIDFHEEIQTKVVDLIYLGGKDNMQKYLNAGRINKKIVEKRIKELSEKYNISTLISKIRNTD